MTTIFVLSLIIMHFIFDWWLQTNNQAMNKSSDNLVLTHHVLIYFIGLWLWAEFFEVSHWWIILNGVMHWITDWLTSRGNVYLYKKYNRSGLFKGIAFDQMIHFITLLLTLRLFK